MNLFMKHFLFLLFFLTLGINAYAEEKQSIHFLYSMDNFQTEPQEIWISLFETPKLQFNDGLLNINVNKKELSFQESFIYGFSYSSTYIDTAIRTPKTSKKLNIELRDNSVFLRDLHPNARLYVYTLDGKVVKEFCADSQGIVNVSLPEGVYIIKVQEQQFKISIK